MSMRGKPTRGQPYMRAVIAAVPKRPAKIALPKRNDLIMTIYLLIMNKYSL
jgi:hypothetical protein